MRVLDLGCGSGRDLASWGVIASDEVTGLDIDHRCVAVAKVRFPNRTYLQGAGEGTYLTALKPSSSMLSYPPKGINKFTAVNLAALSSNPLRAIFS